MAVPTPQVIRTVSGTADGLFAIESYKDAAGKPLGQPQVFSEEQVLQIEAQENARHIAMVQRIASLKAVFPAPTAPEGATLPGQGQ